MAAKRFHCRCRHCDARRVLTLHPEKYDRRSYPPCRKCKKKNYRIDRWMTNRDTTAARCDCAAYHFPHRRGSLYCWHRKDGSDRLPGHVDFWTRDMTQDDHDALVAQHRVAA
jgi:hypothetical protein